MHETLAERCKKGASVLLFSSELTELFLLCHTIAVLYRNRIVAIRSSTEWTSEAIGKSHDGGGVMFARISSLCVALAVTLVFTSVFLLLNGYSPLSGSVSHAAQHLGIIGRFYFAFNQSLFADLDRHGGGDSVPAGLFNIGGEGQMLTGGLAATLAGIYIPSIAWRVNCGLCLLAGVIIGGLWGLLAGGLKAYRGIHEVITTIMLNFIALQLVNECALNYFSAGQSTSPHSVYQPVILAAEPYPPGYR